MRPASPPVTTCARASARCCWPTPSRAPTPAGRARVEALLGRPDLDAAQVDELRDVIEGSGAVARLEVEIDRLAGTARAALDGASTVDPEARAALLDLVGIATARSS